ncbi:GTP-binding protein [Granulosicoccaceae sp. 1_MG-2023]|nr:GTP-binding protein [Granulosicoccaceae sp. 1_MG-2023]
MAHQTSRSKAINSRQRISQVPTHIITGFLGAGKSTAIVRLLESKPAGERWAVLVNEFGEIGVDGSLLGAQFTEEQGAYISEVPGGCMCCTALLPMQVALNRLLKRARPDRLLIEPTGLGHPSEVLAVLSGPHYQESLSLRRIITLVDARQLADSRYTTHPVFNQQIAIADLVVGNKADLYQAEEGAALRDYVAQHGARGAEVRVTTQGRLEPQALQGPTRAVAAEDGRGHHHHHHHHHHDAATDTEKPSEGISKAQNQGEGFSSVGWQFSNDHVFDRFALQALLSGLTVERMKAVFITDQGVYGYNATADGLTEIALPEADDSRFEMIARDIAGDLEQQLKACLVGSGAL